MFNKFISPALAAAGAVAVSMLATGEAAAATVNTKSNVVFIVDESGSMGGEQSFLETVISDLDTGLSNAGVTDRKYGVVGFGGSVSSNDPRQVGGGLTDATTAESRLGTLTTSGGLEDGYQAIDFALNNFAFTQGAAINFILATDEARTGANVRDASLTEAGITSTLTSSNILLNAIVDHGFSSDNNNSALGVDSDGTAYIANGSGGFTTDTNGVKDGFGDGDEYISVANATGGASWDLNILRNGGNDATSFSTAFVDIKVQEIISQPPTNPIPLPAGLPLILTGIGALGGLGALRRRKARTA